MFEYFNNILTVHASWLYGDGNIITESNYKLLCFRGWINVIRRGCKGTPALVEYSSIPDRFKEVIIEKYGDPQKTTKQNNFKDFIELDAKALQFFNDYTLDSGDALPEKSKNEYVANAVVLNAVHKIITERSAKRLALGGKTSKLWDKMADIISELPRHTYPHSLPKNPRRLKEKYKSYSKQGYESLIHRGFCNKNSEKINDDAKSWLLSRWANQTDRCATYKQLLAEYNALALEKGWKVLQYEKTLYLYLNQEAIVPLWYGNRMGEGKSKEKFTWHFSTKMPTMRDSLWYSDGTKLNFFYLDNEGKIATCQVYEVMDAFSEVFLGFHVSPTENYQAQFSAFKMAVQMAQHHPYEIQFDNQGGHKKLDTGNFLSKLAHLTRKSQPYNGKSKTIESAFGRFQQEFLARYWFFTGQNITAKRDSSRANSEYILANKHGLPTLDQAIAAYVECRNMWNAAPHFATGQPRIQMYEESHNPNTPKINLFEIVNLFWIERPQPVMYSAYGLSFREKNVKYTYMVADEDGQPNFDWHYKNIDKKFVVKFDPEDMSMIYLYENTPSGLRFVTEAVTKTEVHRNTQEQEAWEAGFIKNVVDKNKKLRIKIKDQIDTVQEVHNHHPENYGLVSPRLRGIKDPQKIKGKKQKVQYQDVDKTLSNVVVLENDQDDIDIYKIM